MKKNIHKRSSKNPKIFNSPPKKGLDKISLLEKLRDRDTPILATPDAHGPG